MNASGRLAIVLALQLCGHSHGNLVISEPPTSPISRFMTRNSPVRACRRGLANSDRLYAAQVGYAGLNPISGLSVAHRFDQSSCRQLASRAHRSERASRSAICARWSSAWLRRTWPS